MPHSSPPHPLSLQRGTGRLTLSALVGALCIVAVPGAPPWQFRAVVGWDALALTLLGLSWRLIYKSDARATEIQAADEDPGRFAVFVLAVISSLVSLLAATLVLRMARGQSGASMWMLLALLSVALSWLVTHTAYTLRYAHLFYRGDHNGGLSFPGTEAPTDLDFAYYAFTLGMCFQVSDVQVTSSEIRRVTLGHALIAFVFNTTIVALSLNVMFQLLSTD